MRWRSLQVGFRIFPRQTTVEDRSGVCAEKTKPTFLLEDMRAQIQARLRDIPFYARHWGRRRRHAPEA